jgi:hypothetical protein
VTARALVLLGALAAAPAAAQSMADAGAQNMETGAVMCLLNYRDMSVVQERFAGAGWKVAPGADGAFEATVTGAAARVVPAEGLCEIRSAVTPLPRAQEIGLSLMQRFFNGQFEPGRPDGIAAACDGYTAFPGQTVIWMRFASADGAGCADDGGAIILSM